jgi:hypothetical protein
MAIGGNGQGIDVSMKVGSQLKTSTVGNYNSEYLVVGMQPNTTTVDWTCYLANNATTLSDTQAAYHPIGVNQTHMSAAATECMVRTHGISKVRCAGSVAAGDLLVCYDGVSTTTFPGYVVSLSLADETNVTCATYGATVAVFYCILGRALEDGSTNTVISAIINPTPYDRQFWAHS